MHLLLYLNYNLLAYQSKKCLNFWNIDCLVMLSPLKLSLFLKDSIAFFSSLLSVLGT